MGAHYQEQSTPSTDDLMSFRKSVSTSSVTAVAVAAAGTAASLCAAWIHFRNRKRRRLDGVLQCQCGRVRIQVHAAAPVHLLCYCDDCQNYEMYCKQQKTTDSQTFSRVCDGNGPMGLPKIRWRTSYKVKG
jgi:hypothetical protein